MTDFCITSVVVQKMAAMLYILLHPVSLEQLRRRELQSVNPVWEAIESGEVIVRIEECSDKTKRKVEWKIGKVSRYRHLTLSQIRNIVCDPRNSIMLKIVKSFKGVEL